MSTKQDPGGQQIYDAARHGIATGQQDGRTLEPAPAPQKQPSLFTSPDVYQASVIYPQIRNDGTEVGKWQVCFSQQHLMSLLTTLKHCYLCFSHTLIAALLFLSDKRHHLFDLSTHMVALAES